MKELLCRLLPCLLGLAVALCMSATQAATIAVDSRSVPGLNPKAPKVLYVLRLTGRLEEGDAAKMRTVLSQLKGGSSRAAGEPLATIELNSDGGDVYEGLNLGYLFREFDIATVVRARDSCLSACALAFLGGTASHIPPTPVPDRNIEVGGQVGFHNFYINSSSPTLASERTPAASLIAGFNLAKGGSSLLVRYAAMMAIDPGFIARLLGRPSEEWEYIDIDDKFVTLSSCPIGIDRPTTSEATVATNICNHATGWFSPVNPSRARAMTRGEAKRHLLEHVQRDNDALANKGPLAAQLAAVLASRDDRLVDAVYADLRAAGVPLPELRGPTFEVTGYTAGTYQMQCHVSFSRDDPDSYDVAIAGPSGLARAYRSAPAHCRRLFLWDREDMLNPEKR